MTLAKRANALVKHSPDNGEAFQASFSKIKIITSSTEEFLIGVDGGVAVTCMTDKGLNKIRMSLHPSLVD